MTQQNPWQLSRTIELANSQAERNGFYLDEDRNYQGKVAIKAKAGSGIWTDDTVVVAVENFREVLIWISGWEKREMYEKMAKLPKKKEKNT